MEYSQKELEEIFMQLIASTLDAKSSAYVAGPLDTGRLYYELAAQRISIDHDRIRPLNQQKLSQFVAELRHRLPYPVIDPGLIRIRGWTGREYGDFFIRVIEKFCREAWFIDGWQFSSGATKEFFVCQANGICCLDQSGQILSDIIGRSLIADAVEYVETLHLDSSKLKSRL